MRILHVIPQFPYIGGQAIVGGHASCLLALSLAQHRAGEDVTILSYTHGRDQYSIDDGPSVHSIFSDAVTQNASYGLKFTKAAKKWSRANRDKFDIVHFHSGHADYFLTSSRIKKATKLPVLHTLYCPISRQGGRLRLPIVHGLVRRWAKQIDWKGGMSKNVTDSMTEYGMANAQWVCPAVNIERFKPQRDPQVLRKEFGIDPDKVAVLFVGNAKKQKNAIGVMRAIHELRKENKNIQLVITTELKHSSSDEEMSALAAEMKRLDLTSCTIQKGIIENMPELMQACDILAAPFLDTYGPSDYFIAVLEAMACAKPVVVSNVGGMPEVVAPDVGRLVDPLDPLSIANGLKEYIENKELRLQNGENGLKLLENLFSPETTMKAYQNIYRELTA